jgi:hypothetical protein
LNQPGAKIPEFVLADRSRPFEPIELLDLIGGAESDDTPHFVACLLRVLGVSLCHASPLRDHVNENTNVRDHDQGDHPKRFAPTRNVMTPEQVAKDGDQQPEPHDEHEYREDVDQKVGKTETSVEEHRYLLFHDPRAKIAVINSYVRNIFRNCTLVHGRYPKVQYRQRFPAAYPCKLDLADFARYGVRAWLSCVVRLGGRQGPIGSTTVIDDAGRARTLISAGSSAELRECAARNQVHHRLPARPR